MPSELDEKLGRLRRTLEGQDKRAAWIRTAGNLSWLLCGGDPIVSLSDTPVASAIVTPDKARILVPEIERDRFENEVVPEGLEVVFLPWEDAEKFQEARRALASAQDTLSDGPLERGQRYDFWKLRVPLTRWEVERYRSLAADAAQAVGDTVRGLTPGLTEHQIAGRVAAALFEKGIHPVVLLVGGDLRLKRYRHPLPTDEPVHDRVMVVVSGRRDGLYANLTRLAAFTPLEEQERARYDSLLEIESDVLAATRHGRTFGDLFGVLMEAYARHGQPDAWRHHHQGGPTGYYSRDFFATPKEERTVIDGSAYAWNPSLPGLKVEDTVLLASRRIEVLTTDPEWPVREVAGLERPVVLEL